MKYRYFIVDRRRTNEIYFLTPGHWVSDSHRHQALRFKDKKQA